MVTILEPCVALHPRAADAMTVLTLFARTLFGAQISPPSAPPRRRPRKGAPRAVLPAVTAPQVTPQAHGPFPAPVSRCLSSGAGYLTGSRVGVREVVHAEVDDPAVSEARVESVAGGIGRVRVQHDIRGARGQRGAAHLDRHGRRVAVAAHRGRGVHGVHPDLAGLLQPAGDGDPGAVRVRSPRAEFLGRRQVRGVHGGPRAQELSGSVEEVVDVFGEVPVIRVRDAT